MARVNRLGEMRDAGWIQRQVNDEADDAAATVVYENVDAKSIPCGVSNVSPYSSLNQRGYNDVLTHRFEIRYRPDVDISNYFLFRDVRYGIANIQDVNMKRQRLYLYCYIVSEKDVFQDPSPDQTKQLFGGLMDG